MTILKVMVPHSSDIPNPMALVYDHTREIWKIMPITKYLMQIMAGRFQIFIEGELSANAETGLKIEKVLELSEEKIKEFDKVGIAISKIEAIDDEQNQL